MEFEITVAYRNFYDPKEINKEKCIDYYVIDFNYSLMMKTIIDFVCESTLKKLKLENKTGSFGKKRNFFGNNPATSYKKDIEGDIVGYNNNSRMWVKKNEDFKLTNMVIAGNYEQTINCGLITPYQIVSNRIVEIISKSIENK